MKEEVLLVVVVVVAMMFCSNDSSTKKSKRKEKKKKQKIKIAPPPIYIIRPPSHCILLPVRQFVGRSFPASFISNCVHLSIFARNRQNQLSSFLTNIKQLQRKL